MKKKKGFTILELLVSMTIFLTLTTLLVGAYATIVRTKGLATTRKETEQKTRLALEMIARLSRQANKVKTTNLLGADNVRRKNLFLYFEDESGATTARFYSASNQTGLYYFECPVSKVTNSAAANFCTGNWTGQNGIDLLAGTANNRIQVNSASFTKEGGVPGTLSVDLDIATTNTNAYYADTLKLSTKIILENLK